MLFSLKFQRNNQKNALVIGFAKGKTGEKGCIFTILWDETTAYYDRAYVFMLHSACSEPASSVGRSVPHHREGFWARPRPQMGTPLWGCDAQQLWPWAALGNEDNIRNGCRRCPGWARYHRGWSGTFLPSGNAGAKRKVYQICSRPRRRLIYNYLKLLKQYFAIQNSSIVSIYYI